MFSKASEIEWFSIDKELSPSHLHRPDANWETVLIWNTLLRGDIDLKLIRQKH